MTDVREQALTSALLSNLKVFKMMDIIETVKIKSSETDLGYIIINKSDFDSKVHEVYEEPKAPKK